MKKGNLSSASSLFDKAIIYDPIYKKQGYDFFMSLGDRAQSVHYYERALQYTDGDKDKNKRIGFKILKIATNEWPGSRCEFLRQKAGDLVEQDIIDQIFPQPYMKTVFEKNYTYSDAFNKKGYIKTVQFGTDVNEGDKVEVIVKTLNENKFTGSEISIFNCKKCDPEWFTTKNGYYQKVITHFNKGKYLGLSTRGREDVDILIIVKRKKIPGPNLDLLSSYLKE